MLKNAKKFMIYYLFFLILLTMTYGFWYLFKQSTPTYVEQPNIYIEEVSEWE